MTNCPFVEICNKHKNSYSNFPDKFVKLIEGHYCYGNQKSCARYLVGKKLGKDSIPKNLKPNDIKSANRIIQNKKEPI